MHRGGRHADRNGDPTWGAQHHRSACGFALVQYLIAHDTLISGPRLTQEDQVDAELKAAGVDMAALAKDRETHRPVQGCVP